MNLGSGIGAIYQKHIELISKSIKLSSNETGNKSRLNEMKSIRMRTERKCMPVLDLLTIIFINRAYSFVRILFIQG